MSVIERVVRVFAPHVCIGCGAEDDRLLCHGCMQELVPVASRCYRCGVATQDYRTCTDCQTTAPLRQVVVGAEYKGVPRKLIRQLKYERAQAGVHEMADLLAEPVWCFPADALLVHVPTASSRVRMRGYDHAALLTREIARATGMRRARLLARHGQARQVGASRAQRLRQLEGAFRPVQLQSIRGRHIVLVDDVLTTGTTLETAAQVLYANGAARVDAIVFAQA